MPMPIRRRWLLLSSVLLGGLLLGLAAIRASQQEDDKAPAAKATNSDVFAVLFVDSSPPVWGDDPKFPFDPKGFRRGQLALLRSRLVLNSALRDLAVAKLPIVQQQADQVEWLERHLHAEFRNGADKIHVGLRAGTPTEQAILINAVAEAYLREIDSSENHGKRDRLNKLKKLRAAYDKMLKSTRDNLERIAKNEGSHDAELVIRKVDQTLTQLSNLHTELFQVESQLGRAQRELAKLDKEDREISPADRANQMIEKDAVVAYLRAEVKTLGELVAAFKARAVNPENEPAYQRALSRLKASTKALAARRELLRPDALALAGRGPRGARADVADKLNLLKALERALIANTKSCCKELTDLKPSSKELGWMIKRIADLDEIARVLAREMHRLEVELEAPPRARLVKRASAPK